MSQPAQPQGPAPSAPTPNVPPPAYPAASAARPAVSAPAPPRMTPYERWSLVVNVSGIIAIVAGLTYSARQITEMGRQTENAVLHSTLNNITDLDKVMVDNAALRPYFNAGKDIRPDHPDYQKAEAIAEMTLDVFDIITRQRKSFLQLWERTQTWDIWIKESFISSPLLRRYFEAKQQWYGPKLMRLYEEAKRERDSGNVRKGG